MVNHVHLAICRKLRLLAWPQDTLVMSADKFYRPFEQSRFNDAFVFVSHYVEVSAQDLHFRIFNFYDEGLSLVFGYFEVRLSVEFNPSFFSHKCSREIE